MKAIIFLVECTHETIDDTERHYNRSLLFSVYKISPYKNQINNLDIYSMFMNQISEITLLKIILMSKVINS